MDEYKSRLSAYLSDMVREELEKYDGGFTDEWNDQRKKNAEVLGYKLSGKSDIKEAVKDPKLKVGQKIRHKNDPRKVYTLKKITHGNRGIPEDPAGTSYMFVASGNRKEYHTKKTWAQAIKKGWIIKESINESGMGILDKDQTDVLHAIVMRNKNKNSNSILKIALKDRMFKGIDKRELLGYIEGAKQFVRYMGRTGNESVNEQKKRDANNLNMEFEKSYQRFTVAVNGLVKSMDNISGEKTDGKIIVKAFKKYLVPFHRLVNSWNRGQQKNPHLSESVNEAVEPQGNMAKIAKVVKDKQATKLSGVMIDIQSASLLMKLWDAVSDKDKEKMNTLNPKVLTTVIKKLWSRVNLKLPL